MTDELAGFGLAVEATRRSTCASRHLVNAHNCPLHLRDNHLPVA